MEEQNTSSEPWYTCSVRRNKAGSISANRNWRINSPVAVCSHEMISMGNECNQWLQSMTYRCNRWLLDGQNYYGLSISHRYSLIIGNNQWLINRLLIDYLLITHWCHRLVVSADQQQRSRAVKNNNNNNNEMLPCNIFVHPFHGLYLIHHAIVTSEIIAVRSQKSKRSQMIRSSDNNHVPFCCQNATVINYSIPYYKTATMDPQHNSKCWLSCCIPGHVNIQLKAVFAHKRDFIWGWTWLWTNLVNLVCLPYESPFFWWSGVLKAFRFGKRDS